MKTLLTSKFILAIKEISTLDVSAQLPNLYEEFIIQVFEQSVIKENRESNLNNLVYTKFELITLKELSGKKYNSLSLQSYCNY